MKIGISITANGGGMKRSGERAAKLSTDTEQQASNELANCT